MAYFQQDSCFRPSQSLHFNGCLKMEISQNNIACWLKSVEINRNSKQSKMNERLKLNTKKQIHTQEMKKIEKDRKTARQKEKSRENGSI